MIWYLLLCGMIHGQPDGRVCNPPEPMRSKAECLFIAEQYKTMNRKEYASGARTYIKVKCVGAKP